MRAHPVQLPAPLRSAPVSPRLRAVPAEQPSLDALASMLAPSDLPFRLLEHEPGEARKLAWDLGLVRDSVLAVALLGGGAGHWLTVTSATRVLDLRAASRAVGEPLAIAGPDAVREVLGDVDPAALCPLTTEPRVWPLIDQPVIRLPRAVCPAGSQRRSIVIEPAMLVELLRPLIAPVSIALSTG